VKFALVSHVLPPSASGHAILIYRLLKDLVPETYCLIAQPSHLTADYQGDHSGTLSGRYYRLPLELLMRGLRFGFAANWRRRLNLLFGTAARGVRIAIIARREHCKAIVAFTGNLIDLPASYLASRLLRIPFYAYILDDYSVWGWSDRWERTFAERVEPTLLRGAGGIITPNAFLQATLRQRYGVETTIIHNPCDLADYESVPMEPVGKADGEVRIVYTGAIYWAHYDAFQDLLVAIRRLGKPELKLHLYTAQPPAVLAEQGICGPIVFHEHRATAEMPGIQQGADLLFLPLAFDSPFPEQVRTAAPFKVGEYLAARRPILVHAPADSFVAWYFRHYDCGLVVDQPAPALLAEAIERILTDAALRQRLTANAWARANADFSIATAQAQFAELLDLDLPRGETRHTRQGS